MPDDPYRPSSSPWGPPWIDTRNEAVRFGGRWMTLSREIMEAYNDIALGYQRHRIVTHFDRDSFWVDLWPWRVYSRAMTLWNEAKQRIDLAWRDLRHGSPIDPDYD